MSEEIAEVLPDDSASQLQQSPAPKPDKRHTSVCWYFFKIPDRDEAIPQFLNCYFCQKPVKYNKKGSGNLTDHARNNHKMKFNEFQELTNDQETVISTSSRQTTLNLAKAHRFNEKLTNRLLIEWIIADTQAFIIAEKPAFLAFLQSLNPDYKPPKADSVKSNILSLYKQYKCSIKEELKNHGGKLSFTTDIWTSPSSVPFICVTVHYIDAEWNLKHFVLAFRHIPGKHTGVRISTVFCDILKEYDVLERTLCVTLDNASNNDTFIDDLISKNVLRDKECQVRCFPHVMNLAAQVSLQEFIDKIEPLRIAIKAIRYSPLKLDRLETFCGQEDPPLKFVKPILDVKTRWNSTFDMLERTIRLKSPLIRIFNEIAMEPRKSGEDPFPIFTHSDWETYRLISDLLRPFKEVTVEISGDSYPTFSTSLPLYNYLMDHLTSKGKVYDSYLSNIDEKKQGYEQLPSQELCDDLRSAASLANEKLTGYYDVQSDLAICATILDPRLNISYYELPEQTKAQNLRQMESAKMEVLHYYNEMGYKPKIPLVPVAEAIPTKSHFSLSRIYKKPKIVFDAVSCQVEQYCCMDPISENTNPLQWWKSNSDALPNLSEMARDVLAIPGSAVPSERTNSEAREMLPYTRNRLSPEVIEATLVSKSFLRGFGNKK